MIRAKDVYVVVTHRACIVSKINLFRSRDYENITKLIKVHANQYATRALRRNSRALRPCESVLRVGVADDRKPARVRDRLHSWTSVPIAFDYDLRLSHLRELLSRSKPLTV